MDGFAPLPRRGRVGDVRCPALALILASLLLFATASPSSGTQPAAGPSPGAPEAVRVTEAEYLARLKTQLPEFFDTERYAATPTLFRARVAGDWIEQPLVRLRDVPEEVTLLFNAVLFQLSDKAYYQPHTVRRLLEGVVGFETRVRGRLANLAPIKMYLEQYFSAGPVLANLVRDNPEGAKENLAMAWYKTRYGSGGEARRFLEQALRTGLRDEEDFLLAAKVYEALGDQAAARAILAEQPAPRR